MEEMTLTTVFDTSSRISVTVGSIG